MRMLRPDACQARVLNQKDKVEVTLKPLRLAPSGWLDRVLDAPVQPITLTLQVTDFDSRSVGSRELVQVLSLSPEALRSPSHRRSAAAKRIPPAPA